MSSFLLTNSIIFQPGEFCDPKSEFHGTGGRLEPHVGSGPALPCQIMSVEDSTGLKGKSAGNQWWVFRTRVTVGFPCFCPSQFHEYWLQQQPFNNSKVVMLSICAPVVQFRVFSESLRKMWKFFWTKLSVFKRCNWCSIVTQQWIELSSAGGSWKLPGLVN